MTKLHLLSVTERELFFDATIEQSGLPFTAQACGETRGRFGEWQKAGQGVDPGSLQSGDPRERCSIQRLERARLTLLSEKLYRGRALQVVSTAGPPSIFHWTRSYMIELRYENLRSIRSDIRLPDYDRSQLRPGIVQLGVGNFHRVHQ